MDCTICFDSFDTEARVPLALPCQHTFCKQCVQGFSAQSGGQYICPVCRNPFIQGQAKINMGLRDALEKFRAVGPRPRSRSRSPNGHEKDRLPEDLTQLTVSALKVALKERGLQVGGKKAELVRRLTEARRAQPHWGSAGQKYFFQICLVQSCRYVGPSWRKI